MDDFDKRISQLDKTHRAIDPIDNARLGRRIF